MAKGIYRRDRKRKQPEIEKIQRPSNPQAESLPPLVSPSMSVEERRIYFRKLRQQQ